MRQFWKPSRLISTLLITLAATTLSFSPAHAFGSGSKSPEEEAAEKIRKGTNEYNKGVKHMDKAQRSALAGDSAFAYNYRATADAKAKKEYKKAAKRFEKAVKYNPEMKEAYSNLGYCYRKLDQLDRSLKAYHQALILDPNFEQAHEYLGETYLAMDLLGKAEAQFDTLIQLESAYADTLSRSIDLYKINQVGKELKKTKTAR